MKGIRYTCLFLIFVLIQCQGFTPSMTSNTSCRVGIDCEPRRRISHGQRTEAQPFVLRAGAGEDDGTEQEVVAKKNPIVKEMIAEAFGTAMIVHLGCGTVCAALYKSAQVGLFQIAAVWAFAVSLAIYCTAAISGAHLNPAMTLAFSVFRKFPKWKIIPYVFAQLVGAILAASSNYLLYAKDIFSFETSKGIVRGSQESYISASAFGEYFMGLDYKTAFFAEFFGTAVLAFVIFSLTNEKNDEVPKGFAPALIGATVGALISVIAPLTQAGFNPARDFGPRIVTWFTGWKAVSFHGWWVYVIAPLLGSICGAFSAEKVLWRA
mmetsp:Transcript_17030/g.22087  ORF Transcript_17030/g.22087 Transcript_17030/m.22087 type:complete len:322 (+) Transcript_17030:111-1076(+)